MVEKPIKCCIIYIGRKGGDANNFVSQKPATIIHQPREREGKWVRIDWLAG